MLPSPPIKLIPPTIAAVKAMNSVPGPNEELVVFALEIITMVAMAVKKPQRVYMVIFIFRVLIPDNLEASSFPPKAINLKPNTVSVVDDTDQDGDHQGQEDIKGHTEDLPFWSEKGIRPDKPGMYLLSKSWYDIP